jgi:formate hydrogenlyase subunit 3/multisubunit Na+/H+ antiporter MnhD subunit
MALSAFILITAEDQRAESRQAGWFYLLPPHVGTLALFALFALWLRATGSFAMDPAAPGALSLGTSHLLSCSRWSGSG